MKFHKEHVSKHDKKEEFKAVDNWTYEWEYT